MSEYYDYTYIRFLYAQILDEIKKTTTRFQDPRSKDMYVIDYPEDYEKRILSMEGYPNIFDKEGEFLWEKRAPMGFHGMRGKKLILDPWQDLDKQDVMEFQVSKVCKVFPNALCAI